VVPRLSLIALNAAGLQFWEYETLAENVAAGQGYVIARFGHLAFAFGDGNLYSFVAATVYVAIGHQPVVLAIVQAVLASLAAPVIFEIGRRAFGWKVAALGAGLAALHPGLLAYTLKLHPLGLDVLLMALSVLWIHRAADTRGRLLTGLALGMSLMTRPTFFLGGAVALAIRWVRSREHVVAIVVPLVVALAIAAPWVTRNWAVLGRPVFISTSLEDVWKGNNPIASGSSYLAGGSDVFSAAPPEVQYRFVTATELELNDVFASEIFGFVSAQPADFVALTARKFVYFWWASPQVGLLYPGGWLVPYQVYFALVMLFALVGAIVITQRGAAEERALLGSLVAISLTLAIIHALSYVEGRQRWGIEPLLLLLTARGVFAVAGAFGSDRHVVRNWFVRLSEARRL
jgi:hypothetical protein